VNLVITLTPVKSLIVSQMLKTLGELKIVKKVTKLSTVNLHISVLNVQMLNLVKISILLLKKISPSMIPMVMVILT
jgi:hypothetical protein